MPLRFAIMGTGRIAGKVTPYIQAAEGCEVVAVASRDADRARSFASQLGIGETPDAGCTYDDLLARDDIDAVYITLPNGDHPVWSERLLEAGKHVLCEKPLCWTRDQAERLFDAATANDRVLAEAFMYLHAPLTAKAVAIARTAMADPAASPIGKLMRVEAHFDISIEDGHTDAPKSNVRYSRALMGGSLMDLGCYPISFVRTVLGDPIVAPAETCAANAHMVDLFEGSPRDGTDAVDGSVAMEEMSPSGVAYRLTCSMVEGVDDAGRPSAGSVNGGEPRNLARLIGEQGIATVHHFSRPERIEIASEAGTRVIDATDADPMAVYTRQAESFARAASGLGESTPSAAWSIEQAGAIERVLGQIGLRFDEPAW